MTPPAVPATTQQIDMTLGVNETGSLLFFMNAKSFRANYK